MLRAVRELRRAARSSSPRTMRVKAQLGASFGSTASRSLYQVRNRASELGENLKLFDLRKDSQSVSQLFHGPAPRSPLRRAYPVFILIRCFV